MYYSVLTVSSTLASSRLHDMHILYPIPIVVAASGCRTIGIGLLLVGKIERKMPLHDLFCHFGSVLVNNK
jgi:hypothetical protein